MKLYPKHDEKNAKLEVAYDEAALRSELEELTNEITGSGKEFEYLTFKGRVSFFNGHDWGGEKDFFLTGCDESFLEWKRCYDGSCDYEIGIDALADEVLRGIRMAVDDIAGWLVEYRSAHYGDEEIVLSFRVEGFWANEEDFDEDGFLWGKSGIAFKWGWVPFPDIEGEGC